MFHEVRGPEMLAAKVALALTVLIGAISREISVKDGVFSAGPRHLYMHCEGERHGPVVILSTGLYRETSDWKLITPQIATFTKVCAYDREGLGKSTVDHLTTRPETETMDEQKEDLANLLQTTHIDPPYLLVGHSAGGILIRRFTRSFPERVAGLVLIDSAHEEQVWRFQAIDSRSIEGPPADPAIIKRGGGLSPGELLDWHYDKPLIVLEHGKPLSFQGPLAAHAAEFNAAVDAMARDLANRSPRGQLRIAIRSGHEIMLDEPSVVIEAVRDVWDEAVADQKKRSR